MRFKETPPARIRLAASHRTRQPALARFEETCASDETRGAVVESQ
ncbi:hypothetical protein EKH55_4871 [Sinorhizobium alkalisoli]|nr:hypothetical protein EKH55_4871 [Sinorhizobium alkalisoli]